MRVTGGARLYLLWIAAALPAAASAAVATADLRSACLIERMIIF
jgi:hypothetical protein